MAASNNSLFTFSFKLILFLCVLGAFIWVLLIPFAPDIDSNTRYVYAINLLNKEKNKEKYDIAFFGNSYSFTAFDPTIIENKLGLKSIHVNSSAQVLESSLIVARDFLKKNSIKYAFFEVSGASLRNPESGDKEFWYYQMVALQETPLSLKKFIEINKFFPIKGYKKYHISALSKNMGRLLTLNDINNYKSPAKDTSFYSNKRIYFSYNGYTANNQTPMREESFKKDFNSNPIESQENFWTDERINLLKEFIEEAQKNGTQVILTQTLKSYPTIYDDTAIQEIIKKYNNVHFVDLNLDRDKYSLDAQSFSNSTHVNYRGSYQETQRLVDSLSLWYKIPIKNKTGLDFKIFQFSDFFYNLDNSQDKFVKFEFDSIPEILRDHKLIVSLYPNDPDLLSDKTKKSNYDSDNYSFNLTKDVIDVGTSKVFIKKLDTKITEATLNRLMIYFYNPKDTLRLPTRNIYSAK